jgi:superfamily II DNA/RNA helicase
MALQIAALGTSAITTRGSHTRLFCSSSPVGACTQALPIIMSGRDCIGIAKTGSGKTLAFVLPMLRHIKDQPPLANGDGPIALIMAPTRELVAQISKVRCDQLCVMTCCVVTC